MLKSLGISVAGLIAAGVAFVILYPILGVTLWVSFLVAGCILAVSVLASATKAEGGRLVGHH